MRLLLTGVLLLACAGRLEAHDPGLSGLEVTVDGPAIRAVLTVHPDDLASLVRLDADADGDVSREEIESARRTLWRLFDEAVDVRGTALGLVDVGPDAKGAVRAAFEGDGPEGPLVLRSALLARLPWGHRQYFRATDGDGRIVAERVLAAGAHEVTIDAASRQGSGAAAFVALGLHHILAGYDHLVFLLGLLLVTTRWREVFAIVTAFTAAHSITLALAALRVVSLPAGIVEPVIAASIVYVGLENLFGVAWSRRWTVAFGFGLVHGFGFASALGEVAGDGPLLLPLVSFNAGVELGQLAVAAVAVPVLRRIQQSPRLRAAAVPAGSLAVVAAGAWWLAQRVVYSGG